MMKELKSAMTASISEVLETMFYMPLECDDSVKRNPEELFGQPDLRVCRLDFSGKLSGRFIMMIPESLLVTMAADFMGEDPLNIKRQHSDGIIKEVLNMVAGHMFSTMDSNSEFKLGIPEIVDDPAVIASFKQGPPEGLLVAEAIDGLIVTSIELDE
jgi:chemotaxis protein CheY-P-specific phosphatase CheC